MLWLTLIACGFEAEVPESPAEVEAAVEEALENVANVAPEAALGRVAVDDAEPPPIEPVVTIDGVGFVGHDTTRKQLEKKLGAQAIAEHRFDQGEGMYLPGLQVLGGTPYELLLQTDGETVERIEIVGDAYRLANGLHVGSTMAELTTALGAFEIFGYGWDYGGTVVTRDGFEGPGFQLAVRTEPVEREAKAWSATAQEVLRGGDRRFASTHEAMGELDPHVSKMTLVWRESAKDKRAKKPRR
ncbi:MAG: hypothetical protein AAF602_12775 [Myxococcota bacterium]